VIPGWDTVTERVATGVAMKPGIVALTVVPPESNGWNAIPPLVVSNGV
jgi:hypothetical protein